VDVSFVAPMNQRRKSSFFDSLIVVLFLLSPKFGVLDFTVLALVLAWFCYRYGLVMSSEGATLCKVFFAILGMLVFTGAVNQGVSLDLLLKPIRNLLILLFLFSFFKARRLTWEQLFSAIAMAGLVNSIVVLVQVFFAVKGWDVGYLRIYPEGETVGGLRQPGLSSGYPSSGMLCCIGAIVALCVNYFQKKSSFFWVFVGCLPGVFLSARTAVILFMLAFGLIVITAVFRLKVQFLAKIAALSAVLAFVTGFLVSNYSKAEDILYVMFEFVFVYFDDHTIGVRSTDDLLENHYFLPSNWVEWAVGNGKAAWGEGGIPSDVWFVQNLVGAGLVTTTLYIFAFLYMFALAMRASRGYQKTVVFLVFVMVLLSSFKGSFIFSRFVGDVATVFGIYALASLSERARLFRRSHRSTRLHALS
jgi:hypothetical protein